MFSTIRTIFWAIVLILALSFFGISIQSIVTSPTGQANFAYIHSVLSELWQWLTAIFGPIVSLLPNFKIGI